MWTQLITRGFSVYPRLYMQFVAFTALLIAAEFSMGTLTMMLTQRAVYRVSQRVRHRREERLGHDASHCCA